LHKDLNATTPMQENLLVLSAFEEENATQRQIEYAQNSPPIARFSAVFSVSQHLYQTSNLIYMMSVYIGEVIRKPHISGMQGYDSTGSVCLEHKTRASQLLVLGGDSFDQVNFSDSNFARGE
jgi:hypothetical protein